MEHVLLWKLNYGLTYGPAPPPTNVDDAGTRKHAKEWRG